MNNKDIPKAKEPFSIRISEEDKNKLNMCFKHSGEIDKTAFIMKLIDNYYFQITHDERKYKLGLLQLEKLKLEEKQQEIQTKLNALDRQITEVITIE